MHTYHEANRAGWDAVSDDWQARVDAEGVWRRCAREPALVFAAEERAWLGDIAGQAVCVLGSGDNLAVFALAGMGARVTSVDISQAQLDTAARRAGELGLDIAFLRSDVTDLSALADGAFDLVYTGGHVAVWVSDLPRYYAEAVRILRPGGLFLVNEYHPYRRIWRAQGDGLALDMPYFTRGPFVYERTEGTGAPDGLPSYEFHWTVSDMTKAVLDAGCDLLALQEFGDGREAWETVALEGLPLSLLLIGRKR